MISFLKHINFLLSVALILVVVLSPLEVFAQGNSSVLNGPGNSSTSQPPGNSSTFGPNTLQNPLAVDSICELIALLLKAAIAIGIPIAVLFIVWAGFKFIVARGNPGELSEARSNLVATLIGIAIFIGASLIANVIIATLAQLGVNGITSCTF